MGFLFFLHRECAEGCMAFMFLSVVSVCVRMSDSVPCSVAWMQQAWRGLGILLCNHHVCCATILDIWACQSEQWHSCVCHSVPCLAPLGSKAQSL